MFNFIYWPMVGLFLIAALFGASVYATILGVALVVVGIAALLLQTFEKYATVSPVDEPVNWKPLSDNEWLFAAFVQGFLLVLVTTVIFTI